MSPPDDSFPGEQRLWSFGACKPSFKGIPPLAVGRSQNAAPTLGDGRLTGCRKSESLTLHWDDVDCTAGEFRFRDTKRGPRMASLATLVLTVLDGIERVDGDPWVIRNTKRDACLREIAYYWNRIHANTGLEDMRIRDLRHSHASRAFALRESLTMIDCLLATRSSALPRGMRISCEFRPEKPQSTSPSALRRIFCRCVTAGGLYSGSDHAPASLQHTACFVGTARPHDAC